MIAFQAPRVQSGAMKLNLAVWVLIVTWLTSSFAGQPQAKGRTLEQLDVIPTRVLKRAISPKFYDTLVVSPVEGWVVVRGQLVGTKIAAPRIIRSDMSGQFDSLALQRAGDLTISRTFKADTQNPLTPVLLHLLIYKVADGTLALSFASLDSAGGDQHDYFGCSKLEVLKHNGTWTEIKGPPGLQGKGLMVRAPGLAHNLEAIKKLERIGPK